MHAAIVTGVSRGLGESLAAQLLARGFMVQGIGRTSSGRLGGERYRFTELDLTNTTAIGTALGTPWQALVEARPDSICLINNAATAGPVGLLGKLADEDMAASLGVNLAAPIALANLFCRVFTNEALPRRIINVSSGVLPSVGLFEGFHKSGQLVAPDVVAAKIVDRLVVADVEQGRTYSYKEL